jgi:histidyl-tRNA synthetase
MTLKDIKSKLEITNEIQVALIKNHGNELDWILKNAANYAKVFKNNPNICKFNKQNCIEHIEELNDILEHLE